MTEGDFSPHYEWNNGEIDEIETDDRKAFLHKHKDHKTELLTPLTPHISEKPYGEPLRTSYFEATNGTKRFLIKQWRSTIEDPFTYEIIEGKIKLTNGTLRAQTTAIKQQLQAENNLSLSERKVNYFLQAVRAEVKQLDPDTLAISAEGETPLASFYQLGSTCIERILARCRDKFTQRELKKLRDFINRNNEYDDVMTVISKKEFTITKGMHKKNSRDDVLPDQRVAISR
jgi:hypothetical protein